MNIFNSLVNVFKQIYLFLIITYFFHLKCPL